MSKSTREERMDKDGFFVSCPTYITNRRTCVAVKIGVDSVKVRDTKDTTKTTLTFNHEEWNSFIKGVKNGEFDIS